MVNDIKQLAFQLDKSTINFMSGTYTQEDCELLLTVLYFVNSGFITDYDMVSKCNNALVAFNDLKTRILANEMKLKSNIDDVEERFFGD